MLDNHEFRRLYDLTDIRKARPSKIRSNSVGGQTTDHEFSKLKHKRIKRCLSAEFTTKLSILKRFNQFEINFLNKDKAKNFEMSEAEWRKSLLKDSESFHPSFNARDIKQPQIYVMGNKSHALDLKNSKSVQSKTDKTSENNSKNKKNPYFLIESKLRNYIRNDRRVEREHGPVSINKPKTAINRHKVTASPYLAYRDSNNPQNEDAYLKIGDNLKSLIKEDIRINRGRFL